MLAVNAITAGYGALTVLHGVTINIGDGEAVAVVGANGAGKTTLARTICGLQRARHGSIVKDGLDVTRLPPHLMPRLPRQRRPNSRRSLPVSIISAPTIKTAAETGSRFPLK